MSETEKTNNITENNIFSGNLLSFQLLTFFIVRKGYDMPPE